MHAVQSHKAAKRSAKFSSAIGFAARAGPHLTFHLATGWYVGLAAPCLLVLKIVPSPTELSILQIALQQKVPAGLHWRGSNENTNGLLRQYLPRGTDFSRISQSYLNAIALRLNQRPRKTLGFQTPADRLQAVLH